MNKLILELYCEPIRDIKEIPWVRGDLSAGDMSWIEGECSNVSDFDPKGFRKEMYNKYKAGTAQLVCWQSGLTRVIVLSLSKLKPTPDWSITLQAFGTSFRVLWIAHPETRDFPIHPAPLGPINVNGGYTFPCTNNSIVIYRKEEALRVLIHELLHATCTDDKQLDLPIMESRTEAWAEIIYCAILARGNVNKALRLWKHQTSWVLKQTEKLRVEHNVNMPDNYGWRYTVGKAEYLTHWGLLEEGAGNNIPKLTTRLTNPILENIINL